MRLNNNQIIEYRRRGSLFECVSLDAAKDNKVSVIKLKFSIAMLINQFIGITLHFGCESLSCRTSA